MNKDQWLKYRVQEEWPLEIYWWYWNDNKPTRYANLSLQQFERYFAEFLGIFLGKQVLTPTNEIKTVFSDSIIDKIYNHFDKKFNI